MAAAAPNGRLSRRSSTSISSSSLAADWVQAALVRARIALPVRPHVVRRHILYPCSHLVAGLILIWQWDSCVTHTGLLLHILCLPELMPPVWCLALLPCQADRDGVHTMISTRSLNSYAEAKPVSLDTTHLTVGLLLSVQVPRPRSVMHCCLHFTCGQLFGTA